jgi:hypothetical protein
VKEDSEAAMLGATVDLCRTPMVTSRSKRISKENPMKSGIIRNALTTTLALELEYREPSIVRELESNPRGSQDFNPLGDCLKSEFTYLLSLI